VQRLAEVASEPILAALDVAVVRRDRSVRSAVLFDYWTLTKPEINFLIAMTTGAAFCAGCPAPVANFPWTLLLHTLFGTVLVSSGAGTLNQLIERNFDAQMRRTARRPIAAGRVGAVQALIFGSLLSVSGGLYLALTVRIGASLLALLTLGWYLFLYTPLKRQTPICTLVGAFSGAMPVLIGYVAAAGKLDFSAWLFFAILFLWQFPHFMAIAWMYREDYARAGYRVLPAGKDKSRFMEWQSVLPALALIPITVASLILQQANQVLVVATLLFSLSFLYFAARLAGIRSKGSARQLLLVSVVYLLLVFLLHVLARV
jgi:heme o synthase